MAPWPFVLHMGIDWICMARVKASFRTESTSVHEQESTEPLTLAARVLNVLLEDLLNAAMFISIDK